jgi:hypothetical protein
MSVPKPTGPIANAVGKRRRRNIPASYGLAEPVKAGHAAKPPAELGFKAHPLIEDLWKALVESVEGRFYSRADWQRVRLELAYGNTVMYDPHPRADRWAAFQRGLNELLISPADKRRIGIEMQVVERDRDEDAAVLQIAAYQNALG